MGRLTLENAGNLAQTSRSSTSDANIEALPTDETTDEPAGDSNDDSAAAAPELTEETPAPQAKSDVVPESENAATVVASTDASEADVVADTKTSTPEQKIEPEAVAALDVSDAA